MTDIIFTGGVIMLLVAIPFLIAVFGRKFGQIIKSIINFAIIVIMEIGSWIINLPGCRKNILHSWRHQYSWNGGQDIIRSQALPREGHRCYHCGKFRWKETDQEYFIKHADRLSPDRVRAELPDYILANLTLAKISN